MQLDAPGPQRLLLMKKEVLEGYGVAVHNLNVAMHLEDSVGGKGQFDRELKLNLVQCKGNSSVDQPDGTDSGTLGKIQPYM